MNSASKHAVAALFIFCLGCAPKNAKTAPPPQAQAPATTPVPEAGKAGAMYPPPLTESQTQSEQATPAPAPVVAQTEPEPTPPPTPPPATKKTSHKPKPSATKPAGSDSGTTPATGSDTTAMAPGTNPPATDAPEVATSGQPAATTPIGDLTPADTPEHVQKGRDTNDLISKTLDGVNNIKRPLSGQEQETVNQIRDFLDKAKKALGIEDFDGASVLATKAKVLLDELNKT